MNDPRDFGTAATGVDMKLILAWLFSLAALCDFGVSGQGAQSAAWPAVLPAPLRSERDSILDAVINDILTNRKHDLHAVYGMRGDKQCALVSCKDAGVPWPARYRPWAPGWKVCYRAQEDKIDLTKPRLLGIRLERFQPDAKGDFIFDAPVVVVISNVGGGAIIGGAVVWYRVDRDKGKCRVICLGSFAG